MWNDTRDLTLEAERAGVVRLESPFVGVASLLKEQQTRAPEKFVMRESAFLDLVNVRGEPGDPAFVSAFERVVGCRPPSAPNTVSRSAEYQVLWLGPDEWLVRSNEPVLDGVLEAKLADALNGTYAAAVDVGSGYTVVNISGEHAREVLSRGCPLDLHPRVFKVGQCAQSHYFKASIVLIPTADDAFEIVVRRSFADYFCRIMVDAAEPLTS
ncbi:sarcosine oxidase subunit gamma [Paraburkholderia sp. HD33-4]|uniref:sarcosine oxidase subunit gamma n=1 Tax=Paraburkholderia sp. HD33-4 TaxID=2883242 RepID=UPI001F1C6089|nr:sarcosine oxidase subunit gamma [Paraburkholderia sp. HD33-4]